MPDIDVTAPQTLTAALLADAVAAVDARIVFASPAALRRVVDTEDDLGPAQRDALASVRLLMSAGAPVPAALLAVGGRGPAPRPSLHTPYGMTEVLPVTDVSLEEIRAAGARRGRVRRAVRCPGSRCRSRRWPTPRARRRAQLRRAA